MKFKFNVLVSVISIFTIFATIKESHAAEISLDCKDYKVRFVLDSYSPGDIEGFRIYGKRNLIRFNVGGYPIFENYYGYSYKVYDPQSYNNEREKFLYIPKSVSSLSSYQVTTLLFADRSAYDESGITKSLYCRVLPPKGSVPPTPPPAYSPYVQVEELLIPTATDIYRRDECRLPIDLTFYPNLILCRNLYYYKETAGEFKKGPSVSIENIELPEGDGSDERLGRKKIWPRLSLVSTAEPSKFVLFDTSILFAYGRMFWRIVDLSTMKEQIEEFYKAREAGKIPPQSFEVSIEDVYAPDEILGTKNMSLFIRRLKSGDVVEFSLETGKRIKVYPKYRAVRRVVYSPDRSKIFKIKVDNKNKVHFVEIPKAVKYLTIRTNRDLGVVVDSTDSFDNVSSDFSSGKLLVQDNKSDFYIFDIYSGKKKKVNHTLPTNSLQIKFSKDLKLLYDLSLKKDFTAINTETGNVEYKVQFLRDIYSKSVAFSPDGDKILIRNYDELILVDSKTGVILNVTDTYDTARSHLFLPFENLFLRNKNYKQEPSIYQFLDGEYRVAQELPGDCNGHTCFYTINGDYLVQDSLAGGPIVGLYKKTR